VTQPDNPYAAPRADVAAEAIRATLDGPRAAKAFAAWILAASLLSGVTLALRVGWALKAFDAPSLTVSFLVLAALRAHAVPVAASAASVALAVSVGLSPPSSTAVRRTLPPWLIFAAVPLATPLAACAIVTFGAVTAMLAHGITLAASWRGVLRFTTPEDLLYGLAHACASALVLGALTAAVGARLATVRWRLLVRIGVALLTTALVTAALGSALAMALGSLEE
jgi:hypothetical protein